MPTLPYSSAGQIVLAAVLAIAAFYLLLPKPKRRSVALGSAAAVASFAVLVLWLVQHFGKPTQELVANVLFFFFAAGALVNGTVLVAQRNPARGAISFAFVILSTCGLFLLLAAPFLMAATIIIYAGAIIVTFLFVLMLSRASGPSDENDRSREPLLGSLAGFAFVGLVLFTLYKNAPTADAGTKPPPLPAPVITADEKSKFAEVVARLDRAANDAEKLSPTDGASIDKWYEEFDAIFADAATTMGSSWYRLRSTRLELKDAQVPLGDAQARDMLLRMRTVLVAKDDVSKGILKSIDERRFEPAAAAARVRQLRDEYRLLLGSTELPARNVANIGYVLYANQLLAVELAGTLLLVATIGAVAIAGRRGVAA